MSDNRSPLGSGRETDQLLNKAGEVQQDLKDMGSAVRGAAHEQFDALRGVANEYVDEGRERAMQFEEQMEDQIRQKPLAAIGIAAGIGFLFGILMVRR